MFDAPVSVSRGGLVRRDPGPGIGGVQVRDRERDMLSRLATTLGVKG
jgi:hypothetical protein